MIAPLVTVIIPAKDRIRLVKRAIRSTLNQSFSGSVEVLLVDDGSNPALKPLLGPLSKKIKIIRHSKSKGPSASRNIGLKLARGKYVAFLDSDDEWNKNFLTVSLKALNQTNFVGTLSLSSKVYSTTIPRNQRLKIFLFNLVKDTLLLISYVFNQRRLPRSSSYLTQLSHMLFNKDSIKGLKFDPNLNYCEDWDFAANVLIKDNLLIIPQRLLQFYYSASSLSFTKASTEKNAYYIKYSKTLREQYPNSFYVVLFQIYTKYFLLGQQ
jgi:glycosyltransferase involved in cell wall biosynthesis